MDTFFISVCKYFLWLNSSVCILRLLHFPPLPIPGIGHRALPYPRGKVLGGCSAINGMIPVRGQATDYDGWKGLPGRAAPLRKL